jgi:broad specificity phosphatase PhoE
VRHGRTVMNAQVRFRGRRDVPLDEVGKREAVEAAENLAGEGISAVYTSPLDRAREVAQAIAARSGVQQVVDLFDLINVEYGEWEGLTKEECMSRDPEAFRLYAEAPEEAVCPGGESLAEAAGRVVRGLLEIGRLHPGQSVAAVSHGAMVRLAVLRVAGETRDDWQFKLPTGSATVFEVKDGRLRLVSAIDRATPDPRKAAAGETSDPLAASA